MYRILVCDDERDIVSALRIYLTAEGYEVLEAYNGSEMLRLAATQEVHLILLDVMMPGMDGLSAMAELRKTSNVPVILLTAKSEDTDKVLGLNLGADDYVTKPFNPIEVMARVRSQLRRYLQLGGGQVLPTQVTIGGIMLDDAGRTVTVDGETVTTKLTDGSEQTHTYEYLGSYQLGEGEMMTYGGETFDASFPVDVYKTADDAGEFTYFLFRDDTMQTTWHIEFRYGSDLDQLLKYMEGPYAYWLSAGIDADASPETIDSVIDLFVSENLGGEE